MRTPQPSLVTFAQLAALAKRNGWTLDDLVKDLRGGFGGKPGDPGFETARHYFERFSPGGRARHR